MHPSPLRCARVRDRPARGARSHTVHLLEDIWDQLDRQSSDRAGRTGSPWDCLYLRVGAACEIVRQSTAILTSRCFRPSMRAPISIITLLSSGHLNGRYDVETAAELAHLAGAFL